MGESDMSAIEGMPQETLNVPLVAKRQFANVDDLTRTFNLSVFFEATLTVDVRDICQDPEVIYEYLGVRLRKHVYDWIMEHQYD